MHVLIRVTESPFLLSSPLLGQVSEHLGVPGPVLLGVCGTLAGWNGWLLARGFPWVSRRRAAAFFGVWTLLCAGVIAACGLGLRFGGPPAPPSAAARVGLGVLAGAPVWIPLAYGFNALGLPARRPPPSRRYRVATGILGAGLWAGYAAWLVPHPGATGCWVALAAVQLVPSYYVVHGPPQPLL